MRDLGLEEAIRVAGGVGALARKLGISQPSVSNWARVPAERVLSVEAATGVSRVDAAARSLRACRNGGRHRRGRCRARAGICAAVASLLARAPDAALLERLAALRGDASPLGLAHAALAEAARTRQRRARRARIFRSLHRARPRRAAALRLVLSHRLPARAAAGAAARGSRPARHRARGGQAEPEDHAAILCEIMAGLGEPALAGAAGRRSRAVREASGALDRPLLRRSGAGRGGGFLPPRRNARPGVHGDRNAKPSRCRREHAAASTPTGATTKTRRRRR